MGESVVVFLQLVQGAFDLIQAKYVYKYIVAVLYYAVYQMVVFCLKFKKKIRIEVYFSSMGDSVAIDPVRNLTWCKFNTGTCTLYPSF